MDRRITVRLFLLVVWTSTGGILMVVNGQPTVSAWILTPADRKEGGRVQMRCVARNLEADHIVEWRTEEETLRWHTATIAGTDYRFMFETKQTGDREITQEFTITDLQRRDTDEYVCNVHDPVPSVGNNIVATDAVNLSVLYFPSVSFPICSPDGPVTVDTGTQLNLRCSSEYGNPAVVMHVSQTPPGLNTNRYAWMTSINNDVIITSLDLTVDVQDHNALFQCSITSSYFPGMMRSCTIGPVTVTGVISPTQQTPKEPSSDVHVPTTLTTPMSEPSTQTQTNTTPSTIHSSAITAAVAGGGVLLVAMTAIIICLCNRTQGCRNQAPPTRTETQVSNVDPYMELQKSTDEGNREYMELGVKAQTNPTTPDREANGGYQIPAIINDTHTESHAEYQAVDHDYENPGHDYDKPNPKHTEYEAVQAP